MLRGPMSRANATYDAGGAGEAAATAGLLLAARSSLKRLGLPHPRVAEVLRATGVRASRAYARRAAILDGCAAPARQPRDARTSHDEGSDAATLTRQLLCFLMDHPGAVSGTAARRSYSLGFRRFVLALRRAHGEMPAGAFCRAVHITPSLLQSWQARPEDDTPAPEGPGATRAQAASRAASHAVKSLAQVLDAWQQWHGSLDGFCAHLQRDLGIPWKRGVVTRVLAEHGVRVPRARRRTAAHAPRGRFRSPFPGAQWVSDGTPLTIRVDDRTHRFNLQLVVDTATAAPLGMSLRDQESGASVVEAYRHAVATTGRPPLALLLDQRPCNHGAHVARLEREIMLVHAARGRPQTKGHVEGAFGLLAQTMPRLRVDTREPRALARQILALLVECWARTLNHRPRRSHGGRSRAELYRANEPTPAARAAARTALHERWKHGRRVRAARRARHPSAARAFVRGALARLGIDDADLVEELMAHPFDAVVAGLATYEGKRMAGTLPPDVDGRYLLGVVRRIADHDEGLYTADALWHLRTAARAQLTERLRERVRALDRACDGRPCDGRACDGSGPEARREARVDSRIDAALAATARVERGFWLAAAGALICEAGAGESAALYRRAARRIHAALDLAYRERLACVRALAVAAVAIP